MAKVNLAKALKLKNSLITEINRAKSILVRENSRNERSTSTVDRIALWTLIQDKTKELVGLKSKITVANIGLYPLLAELEEAKSMIAYLGTIPTTDGVQVEPAYGVREKTETIFSAYFTQQKVDETVAVYQKRIEEIQDGVDSYNATTFIEV